MISNVYKVETKFNKDMIIQESGFKDSDLSNITEEILNLKEESVRKALILLGWTPPTIEIDLKVQ